MIQRVPRINKKLPQSRHLTAAPTELIGRRPSQQMRSFDVLGVNYQTSGQVSSSWLETQRWDLGAVWRSFWWFWATLTFEKPPHFWEDHPTLFPLVCRYNSDLLMTSLPPLSALSSKVLSFCSLGSGIRGPHLLSHQIWRHEEPGPQPSSKWVSHRVGNLRVGWENATCHSKIHKKHRDNAESL